MRYASLPPDCLSSPFATPLRAQLVVIDPCESRAGDSDCRAHANANTSRSSTSTARSCGWPRVSETLTPIAFRRLATTSHDTRRWEYGRPWLQGLNSGDAAGGAYMQVARRLDRPRRSSRQPSARRAAGGRTRLRDDRDHGLRGADGRAPGRARPGLQRSPAERPSTRSSVTSSASPPAITRPRPSSTRSPPVSSWRGAGTWLRTSCSHTFSSSFSRGASDSVTAKPRR